MSDEDDNGKSKGRGKGLDWKGLICNCRKAIDAAGKADKVPNSKHAFTASLALLTNAVSGALLATGNSCRFAYF